MSDERRVGEITVEGAKIIFRNFQGKASDYNAAGNRNFGLLLEDDLADQLKADGWNVKYLKPRDEDEEDHRQAWLSVKVKYGKFPPIAMLITSRGKTRLTEETIDQLDYARIKNVDLIVRPYQYPAMNGRPAGISAYLKSIYVTIQEDALEEKYGSVPDADDMDELPFTE
jgi:hypothetical protein